MEQSMARPAVLYFGRGRESGTHVLSHAFYQLEYCISGRMKCLLGEEQLTLGPGELALVPPETPHLFEAGAGGFEFISVKFDWPGTLAPFHGGDAPLQYHGEALARLIGQETALSPYLPDGQEVIADILACILGHLLRGRQPALPESRFLGRLRALVCSRGYHTTVEWLARKLGCSRYQLEYRFRQEQPGGRLKHFIDRQVADLATNHLLYSSMTISQIADVMHFPSLYIFSRFYKRCTGVAPSQARTRE